MKKVGWGAVTVFWALAREVACEVGCLRILRGNMNRVRAPRAQAARRRGFWQVLFSGMEGVGCWVSGLGRLESESP